jgi:hypothetical protein
MTGLFQLLSRDAEGVTRIDDTTRATLAAEAKLETMGIVEALVPGTQQGRIDERFAWQTKVESLGAAQRSGTKDLPINLYRVEVTVSWGTRSVSLEGLRVQ